MTNANNTEACDNYLVFEVACCDKFTMTTATDTEAKDNAN